MRRQLSDVCSLCFPYVMDELTHFEQLRFVRHLRRCRNCQQEMVELRVLRKEAERGASSPETGVPLYLHPFSRQTTWLAACAMLVLIGLSTALPHRHIVIGEFRETASDVHTGLSQQLDHFDALARRVLDTRLMHVPRRSEPI